MAATLHNQVPIPIPAEQSVVLIELCMDRCIPYNYGLFAHFLALALTHKRQLHRQKASRQKRSYDF
ncbi:hypothetical protein A6U92_06995 [Agrobacterium rubi]|nr:hypothetical protein A6U92_06995 [Agrobacterium rubi]